MKFEILMLRLFLDVPLHYTELQVGVSRATRRRLTCIFAEGHRLRRKEPNNVEYTKSRYDRSRESDGPRVSHSWHDDCR
jgi:hypothetical protein